MGEMRRRVAHPDRARHAEPLQRLRLRRHRIGRRGAVVEIQIDQRRGHVFHRLEPHVVGLRRQKPVQQVLRDRLPRLGVAGVFLQTSGTSSQCS
jgi:hypothetical protein